MPTPIRLAGVLILALTTAACTTPDAPVEIFDPYEATNREIYEFNVSLDRSVVRPAARAYGTAVPRPVRRGVSNVNSYLNTPRYILNDLAQGNIEDAGHNFMRFVVNTVFGLGVLDPATEAGLEERPTGFDETLFTWGVPEGAYIVRPVAGPSTERATAGFIVDFFTSPVSYALREGRWVSPTAAVGNGLNTRYEFGDTIDALLDDSADSYAQSRSIYLQNRRFELGADDDFAFDPYEDFPDE